MNINRNKPLREVVRSVCVGGGNVGCVTTRLTIYDDIPYYIYTFNIYV